MFNKIVDNCNGEHCSDCGECCTDFIPLSKNEVRIIKRYIKDNNIPEQVYQDKDNLDVRCPFYVKDSAKHCSIYPVRPQVCRGFKCCLSEELITLNKNQCNNKAFYNKFDEKNRSYNGTFISSHNLFYGNYSFELQALYSMCKCNDIVFNDLLKECYTHYKMGK